MITNGACDFIKERVFMFNGGLVSVTFRGLSVEEIADLCQKNHLTHIEWGSDVHVPPGDLKKAEQTAKLCEEKGLVPFAYGSYYRMGQNKNEFSKYIDTARALNARVIRIWAGTKAPSALTKEEYNDLLFEADEIAEIARKSGITIAAECHLDTLTEDAETAKGFIEKLSSPFFKTYWQPNQFKSFEQNIAAAKTLSPYTVGIHIFNWDKNGRHPLCNGREMWRRYLDIFEGRDIPVMLEFMHDDSPASLAPTAKTLFELIGEK